MFGELREYLLLHRQLALPGLGTLVLDRQPASFDLPNRQIMPPRFQYEFREGPVQPARKFYQWMSAVSNSAERDVIVRFNDFVFDLKSRLMRGDVLDWTGVGRFKKSLGGTIEFTSASDAWQEDLPVTAEKVLRELSEHAVRVGEDERSSAEMRSLLNADRPKRDLGWWAALALLIISILLAGIYFSGRGVNTPATGSHQKVQTEASPATPRFLP